MNREIKSLSKKEIEKIAPAVLEFGHRKGLSEGYSQFSTSTIIKDMHKVGWDPVDVNQLWSRAKNVHLTNYVYHTVQFENPNVRIKGIKENVFPRIVLTNSHDGRHPFRFYFGLFRLVCSNGLVIADETFESFKVRHRFYTMEYLENVIETYVSKVPHMVENISKMKSVTMSRKQQLDFAREAVKVRFPETKKIPINPPKLLEIRRKEDDHNDLWTTYNVIQENLLKGGMKGHSVNGKERTVRKIKSPYEQINNNILLWDIASKYTKNLFK